MILKQITIQGKQGSKEVLQQMLTDLLVSTLQEKGCEKYTLFSSEDEDDTFIIMAGWKDEASLETHKKSEHFHTFVSGSAKLIKSQKSVALTPVEIEAADVQHPLDRMYDLAYDTSLNIPFAGPTTKKILDKAHIREVGKGFMLGFKPFYPRRTFDFIAAQSRKLSDKKKS